MMQKKNQPKIWLTALLSILFPGLGHIYVGSPERGLLFFVFQFLITMAGAFFLAGFFWGVYLSFIFAVLFRIIVVIDAIMRAKENFGRELEFYQKFSTYMVFTVFSIMCAMIMQLVFAFKGKYEFFSVPTASMEPAILTNDKIVANHWAYNNEIPKRGDVVIFLYPKDETVKYIKRIVAIPGDIVEIKNGMLILNGQAKKINTKAMDEMAKTTIENNKFFVLGDNFNASNDSRYWGLVSFDKILARAEFIYFSKDKNKFGEKISIQ